MTTTLGAALRHAGIRLVAVCRQPVSLLLMLCFAVMTVALWPGLAAPSGPWFGFGGMSPAGTPIVALLVSLIYLYLWPTLAALRVGGRAVSAAVSGDDNVTLALPALPVGPKARMVGEMLVIFLFVLVARGAVLLFLNAGARGACAVHTIAGALVFLPIMACWISRTGSFDLQAGMALAVALLELGAQKLGLLAGMIPLAAVSAVLTTAVLVLDVPFLRTLRNRPGRGIRAESVRRKALDPTVRYRRDLVALPMRKYGLLYLLASGFVVALVLAGSLDHLAFLIGMVLALLAVFVLLKPLGSNLLGWGLKGRRGVRPGDLYRALSVLPLRRETILRGIYLYTLAAAGTIWFGAVVLIAVRVYLRTGKPLWHAAQAGGLNLFLWPSLLLVPAVAGFIVSASAGKRALYYTSGLALFAMMDLPMITLAGLGYVCAKGSHVPAVVALVILAVSTLLAWLPPLTLLRRTA